MVGPGGDRNRLCFHVIQRLLRLGISNELTLANTFNCKCSWEGSSGSRKGLTTCQNILLLSIPRIGEHL